MVNEKEPCLNNLFRDKGYYRGEGTHLAFEGRLVTPARLPETKELALDRLIWREERLILIDRLRPPYPCSVIAYLSSLRGFQSTIASYR